MLSILDSARKWIALGFHPIPISASTKRPSLIGWPSIRIETEEDIAKYFQPTDQIGVLLGDEVAGSTTATHADVDLDCLPAVAAARRLLPDTGITYGRLTKPASHYLYIADPAIVTHQYKDPHDKSMIVELRCKTRKGTSTQSVVPYSLNAAKNELIRFEPGTSGVPSRLRGDDLNAAVAAVAAAALLAKYYPPVERHLTELALAGALAHSHWNEEDATRFILAAYSAVKDHDPQAFDRIDASIRDTFLNFREGRETTGLTKLKTLIDPLVIDTVFRWLNVATEDKSLVQVSGAPWRKDLVKSDTGYIYPTPKNVAVIFRNAEEWKDCFGFNEFTQQIVFTKNVPAHSECVAGPLVDFHYACIKEWLNSPQSDFASGISSETVREAVDLVARNSANRFHPVRDYLRSLEWDGITRLETWLHTYFGAVDTDVTRLIGPKFLLSLVGRAMNPGCQADYTLVMESTQGEGKSTGMKMLMPQEEWFTDKISDLHSKDASIDIQGKWLIEMAEMDQISRADVSSVKAFLTRTSDHYREPYGRVAADHPRQCVFFGTTNKREYLKDDTGGRRFWPVPVGTWGVGHRPKKDLIVQDRDMLWAEAVVRYDAKERCYPTVEEEKILLVEQSKRYEDSSWTVPVLQWCDYPVSTVTEFDPDGLQSTPKSIISTHNAVAVREIIEHALRKPLGQISRGDEMRVSGILVSNGWERKLATINKHRMWLYNRPSGSAPPSPKKGKGEQQQGPPEIDMFEGIETVSDAKEI